MFSHIHEWKSLISYINRDTCESETETSTFLNDRVKLRHSDNILEKWDASDHLICDMWVLSLIGSFWMKIL
jgi:hypothetical protein